MSTQTGKSSGQAPPTADEANSTGDAKLSNAELKKLKQAEKAAKRAAAKGEQGPPSASDARPPKPPGGPDKVQNQSGQQQQTPKSAHQRPKAQDKKLLSLPATSAPTRYPTFHFSSLCPLDYQYATRPKQQLAAASSPDLAEGSTYAPGQPLPTGTVNKCIHHAIRALGLQMQALKVCGSTARCVATLSALKQVIESYNTPEGNSLPRHLPSHLTLQLEYLHSCRPQPVATSNAATWLKLRINAIDVSTPEEEAKATLLATIDDYLQDQFTVAAQSIASSAGAKIVDGDAVTTFGRSRVVLKALLEAHGRGVQYHAIVLDAPPLREGRFMATALADAGIGVTYHAGAAVHTFVRRTTKVLLGAHAILGNGALYSRAGSASVALAAKTLDVPVIACAERIKLTERVPLDAMTNELGDPEELLRADPKGLGVLGGREGDALLNVRYDVTPPEYVGTVITEEGECHPAEAVAHVLSTEHPTI